MPETIKNGKLALSEHRPSRQEGHEPAQAQPPRPNPKPDETFLEATLCGVSLQWAGQWALQATFNDMFYMLQHKIPMHLKIIANLLVLYCLYRVKISKEKLAMAALTAIILCAPSYTATETPAERTAAGLYG